MRGQRPRRCEVDRDEELVSMLSVCNERFVAPDAAIINVHCLDRCFLLSWPAKLAPVACRLIEPCADEDYYARVSNE